MDKGNGSMTGMSEGEAQEFHRFYIQGMVMFVGVAVVAHFLVWLWRPWIPGPDGYSSNLIEGVKVAASNLINFVA